MTLLLAGQVTGLAFACGLDLYLTVALLGILGRLDLLPPLPPGLEGLTGSLVIGSAVAMFVVEAIIDKVRHADTVWDTVHTFIRPPAAAFLAIGVAWGLALRVTVLAAILAFLVALVAHATKAGIRMNLNAVNQTRWQTRISALEDGVAAGLALLAMLFPVPTFAVVCAALLASIAFGPRLWGAFQLGVRAVTAWVRSIFAPTGWHEVDTLPDDVRQILDETPLGSAPHRGTRATLHSLGATAPFRNGWLILTADGPVFVYRTLLGTRRIDLPTPREVGHELGTWAHIIRVRAEADAEYVLFLLRDGPAIELVTRDLSPATL